MTTTSPEPVTQKLPQTSSPGRWKNLVAWLLIASVLLFVAIAVPTLLAEQALEAKRQQIARAGGKCELRRVSPAWLKQVAGEDFHSFLDRSLIQGVVFSGEKVSDASLNALSGLTDIRYLVLEDTKVTEKSLEIISQLKSLQTLNIKNTPIKDLTGLEGMPALETMMLDYSKVRNEHYGTVARIPSLRRLSAGSTQMSDAGLAEISRSSSLEELNIAYATLGAQGLAPLQAMTNLKVLVLKDAIFDPADLEAFRAKNPGCKVVL